jgi:LmbE family N-acetylglucosaminyl deacetylase
MLNDFKKILVLAPHTDDGEFHCGGTIAKFVDKKKTVFYLAFALPKGAPKKTLRTEIKMAIKVLGIPLANLFTLNYETRNFPADRQKILDDMLKFKNKLKPDLVLLPSTKDTHQDHQTINQEGLRAFKDISIIGYEAPWNTFSFNTTAFVKLEKKHLDKKLKAVACYKTQSGKAFTSVDFLKGLAKVRGTQIGVQYAEAFEIIRLIIK